MMWYRQKILTDRETKGPYFRTRQLKMKKNEKKSMTTLTCLLPIPAPLNKLLEKLLFPNSRVLYSSRKPLPDVTCLFQSEISKKSLTKTVYYRKKLQLWNISRELHGTAHKKVCTVGKCFKYVQDERLPNPTPHLTPQVQVCRRFKIIILLFEKGLLERDMYKTRKFYFQIW